VKVSGVEAADALSLLRTHGACYALVVTGWKDLGLISRSISSPDWELYPDRHGQAQAGLPAVISEAPAAPFMLRTHLRDRS
jgi:hypothetical protein